MGRSGLYVPSYRIVTTIYVDSRTVLLALGVPFLTTRKSLLFPLVDKQYPHGAFHEAKIKAARENFPHGFCGAWVGAPRKLPVFRQQKSREVLGYPRLPAVRDLSYYVGLSR